MTRFLIRPYVLAFFVCLLMILLSLFQLGKGSIDIQLHDTYLVIAKSHVYYVLAFLFFLFSLFYLILDNWLAKDKRRKFQYFHFSITTICLGLLPPLLRSNFAAHYDCRIICAAIDFLFFLTAQTGFLLYYIFCLIRKYTGLWKISNET